MDPFIVVMVIVLVGIAMLVAFASATAAAWKAAASRLGLEYRSGGLFATDELSGSVRRLAVSVKSVRKGHRQSSVQTRYRVRFRKPLPVELRLEKAGAWSAVGAMLGFHDVQVGDPEFDRQVAIRASDPPAAEAFLTAERRRDILEILSSTPGLKIDTNGLEVTTRGFERNVERLVGQVNLLVFAALRLSAASLEVESGSQAGRPEPVAEAGAWLAARDQLSDPGDPLRGQALPESRLEPPTDGRDPSPVGPTTPVDPALAEDALGSVAVIEALFGTTSALDATATFRERYEGKSVRWSGVVDRVERGVYDFAFGISIGARATVTLSGPEGGRLGHGAVRAILRLTDDAALGLQPPTGRTVIFTGRLVAFDPFARALYLAEADVTAVSSQE